MSMYVCSSIMYAFVCTVLSAVAYLGCHWGGDRWGVEERAVANSHLPRKKNHFRPQSENLVCILTQFLTGRKHAVFRSLGTRILQFNPATKLTITTQKLSKKSRPDQGELVGGGGAVAQSPPPKCATDYRYFIWASVIRSSRAVIEITFPSVCPSVCLCV